MLAQFIRLFQRAKHVGDGVVFMMAGPIIVFLGVMVLSLKSSLPNDISLPFWPYDGILAVVVGIGITIWAIRNGRQILVGAEYEQSANSEENSQHDDHDYET